jgi:6-phosphogluconolactonase (cycloisomerase 2 family)
MNSDFSRRDFLALMGAGSIVTFAVAADSGKLTPTGAKIEVPKPVCIQFATLSHA